LDWRLGPGKAGHKNAKRPPLVTSSRDVSRTAKIFFSVGPVTREIQRYSHVHSLGNTTVLELITNGIDVGFKSPRVKELGPGPIHTPDA